MNCIESYWYFMHQASVNTTSRTYSGRLGAYIAREGARAYADRQIRKNQLPEIG